MKVYTKEPVKPDVVLEMTYNEARVLARILSMVGGDASQSPRCVQEKMSAALHNVGVSYPEEISLKGRLTFDIDPNWESKL